MPEQTTQTTQQTVLTPQQALAERGRRGYMRVMRGESPGLDRIANYIKSLPSEVFNAIIKNLQDSK